MAAGLPPRPTRLASSLSVIAAGRPTCSSSVSSSSASWPTSPSARPALSTPCSNASALPSTTTQTVTISAESYFPCAHTDLDCGDAIGVRRIKLAHLSKYPCTFLSAEEVTQDILVEKRQLRN